MDVKSLVEQVDKLINPTIESLGYDLIDIEYLNEYGRWVLRLYVDSLRGGVNLGDCEKVSHAVSALLDVEDIMQGRYSLEVSSPGIERPLRRVKDFEKYRGSTIRVRTYNKIGDRRNFRGILEGIEGEWIHLQENGRRIEIPINDICKARLQGQDVSASGGKQNG